MRRWGVLAFGLLVVLLGALSLGLQRDPKEIPSPLIGQPFPQLAGSDLTESQRQLGGVSERPRIVNVWASWCAACRIEHRFLLQVEKSLAGRVDLIGLNYKDKPQDALSWLQEQGGDPYLWSLQDPDGRAGLELGVYGVPETFFLDAAGYIRYKHVGPLDESSLQQGLLKVELTESSK